VYDHGMLSAVATLVTLLATSLHRRSLFIAGIRAKSNKIRQAFKMDAERMQLSVVSSLLKFVKIRARIIFF